MKNNNNLLRKRLNVGNLTLSTIQFSLFRLLYSRNVQIFHLLYQITIIFRVVLYFLTEKLIDYYILIIIICFTFSEHKK